MKRIAKYSLAALSGVLLLAGCEEFEEFQTTVGAPDKLIYTQTGDNNLYTVQVKHRPTGSTGEFSAKFPVRSNTTQHGDMKATFAYDGSLVEEYNETNGTTYEVLPEEFLLLENATLTLPENAQSSIDSITVSLTGDLSLLTARRYLAPLRITSNSMSSSEELGTVYVAVETEVNLIRTIESADDMVGFPATGRSQWSADCSNYSYLFDGNSYTSGTLPGGSPTTIDMKETQLVTGLCVGSWNANIPISIEYSLDGETYSQAGTPMSGEYVTDNSQTYVAFYDYFEARYLRLTPTSEIALAEVNIYKIDSEEPTLYTIVGNENLISGKVVHRPIGSTAEFEGAFSVYSTHPSESGYSATLTFDESLVAADNEANGTTYEVLPSEYVQLTNSTLQIAANENKSDDEATVALTGDLSKLTATQGYLAAIKLSSSSAAASESRGVVYLLVKTETNVIRPIESSADMVGFPAGGRSSWTADCQDYANLFDGNTGSSISLENTAGNSITIDMKSKTLVTGIMFSCSSLSTISFEYSVDGNEYLTAGTPTSDEWATANESWSRTDYYVSFYNYIEARYLRINFDLSSSSWYKTVNEIDVYQIESEEPTLYALCGSDNVLTGSVAHTPSGSFNGVNAAFDVYTTVFSASGYTVTASVDNSLIDAYNSANGTSYKAIDEALVKIANNPGTIEANANKTTSQFAVSLEGNLSELTDKSGYLIPVTFSASGAITSSSRGVVYVIVTPVEELFRSNFTLADIEGSLVEDRSGWTIEGESDLYTESDRHESLLDGDGNTYVRTWGGPVIFKIDFGKTLDVTAVSLLPRQDYDWYKNYHPHTILIEYSENGETYSELGAATSGSGQIVTLDGAAYAALYGSQKIRYIRITASYNSNMGTAEFNVYSK